MHSCFLTGQSPAHSDAWAYSSLDTGLAAYLCGTSQDSSLTISSAGENPLNGSACCINHSSHCFVTCKITGWPSAELCGAGHNLLSPAAQATFSLSP